MVRETKVRVVAFISSTLADQYTALADSSGLSRSELIRMALQRGYRSIAAWCEKHRDEFSGDEGGTVESVVSGSARKEVPTLSPIEKLTEYTRVLVEQDPELGVEQVRTMALAQAAVLGVASHESGEVVAAALERLFPSAAGDGAGDSGSVGGDLD